MSWIKVELLILYSNILGENHFVEQPHQGTLKSWQKWWHTSSSNTSWSPQGLPPFLFASHLPLGIPSRCCHCWLPKFCYSGHFTATKIKCSDEASMTGLYGYSQCQNIETFSLSFFWANSRTANILISCPISNSISDQIFSLNLNSLNSTGLDSNHDVFDRFVAWHSRS